MFLGAVLSHRVSLQWIVNLSTTQPLSAQSLKLSAMKAFLVLTTAVLFAGLLGFPSCQATTNSKDLSAKEQTLSLLLKILTDGDSRPDILIDREEGPTLMDGDSKSKIVTDKDRQLGTVGNRHPAEDINMDRMHKEARRTLRRYCNEDEEGSQARPGAGVTYVQWGSETCSTKDSQLLYSGVTVGAFYNRGGTSNYLCLSPEKDSGRLPTVSKRVDRMGYLYGTEYEYPIQTFKHDSNVPCALCYVPVRVAMVMMPGTVTCPGGWTREYEGYLMGEMDYRGHRRTDSVCVDAKLGTIEGSETNTNGALFYHIGVDCASPGIQCPPYQSKEVLTCAVCTK